MPVFFIVAGIADVFLALSKGRLFSDKLRFFPDDLQIQMLEDDIIVSHFKGKFSHVWIYVEFKISGVNYKCKAHILNLSNTSIDSKDLPKMLFVHGTASSSASFAEIFHFFSETFEMVALDLPGFGRTNDICPNFQPKSQAEVIDFYVQFIDECLKAMHIEQAIFLAHSFGGYIATQYALKFPRHITHLVLIDAAGILPTLGDNGAYWAFVFKNSVLQMGRPFGRLGAWFVFVWFSIFKMSTENYYWYSLLSHPSGWGDKCVAQFIDLTWTKAWWNSPIINQIQDIQCPVATIYGAADDIIPQQQGQLLQKLFKIPVTVIPEAGHSPFHNQHARELANTVLEWFASSVNVEARERFQPSYIKVPRLQWERYASSFSVLNTRQTIKFLYSDISGTNLQVNS